MAPKSPQTLYNEAKALEQSGDALGAIKLYKKFLSLHKTHPHAIAIRTHTAQLLIMNGKSNDAIQLIQNSGAAGQKNLKLMYVHAQACAYAGRLKEAHAALDLTLKIDPDYPPAIARLATVMQYEGLKDEALAVVDDAYARGIDAWDIDHTLGELAPRAGRVDEAADRIQRRLSDSKMKGSARIELEYMLSTLLERQNKFTEAWEAASRGNTLNATKGMGGNATKESMQLNADKSVKGYKKRIDQLMSIFNVEMLRSLEPNETSTDQCSQILMISGMPRSGTTLLEQILSAHPQAESAGEATFLVKASANLRMYPNPSEQILRRLSVYKRKKIGEQILGQLHKATESSGFVVDKNPDNDEQIGLLAAVAPGAKMILTRRDPRDIALSCFFRNFAHGHKWAFSFSSIVDMIEIRFKLHEHWLKVIPEGAPWIGLRVGDYQDIVNEPEIQSREIVEFAGLPWDDACLNFSDRKRIVPTLQPHQAAEGVYTGSLAKWVPYAECMGDQLDRLNAICEQFGYPV